MLTIRHSSLDSVEVGEAGLVQAALRGLEHRDVLADHEAEAGAVGRQRRRRRAACRGASADGAR